jgi:hypothetical protein
MIIMEWELCELYQQYAFEWRMTSSTRTWYPKRKSYMGHYDYLLEYQYLPTYIHIATEASRTPLCTPQRALVSLRYVLTFTEHKPGHSLQLPSISSQYKNVKSVSQNANYHTALKIRHRNLLHATHSSHTHTKTFPWAIN